MSMEDLLKAILGGAGAQMPSQKSRGSSQNDPLADILGGILGGGAQQLGGTQQGAGDIGDILGGILGGGAQQSGGTQQGAGGIGDILGGILGGGAQQSGGTQQGAGGIGDILGDILGGILGDGAQQSGGTQQGAGSIGDILGGILGGGSSMSSNTFLGPIVQKLAQQLGLPPAIAQMVVSFVLSKMMGSAAGGAVTPSQRVSPSQTLPSQRPAQQLPQAEQGLNLDDLLGQISTGATVDTGYLNATGLTQELAVQTGLDTDTAATSLQQVFQMLGGALGASQQTQQPNQTSRPGRSSRTNRSRTTSRKRSTPKRGGSTNSGLDSMLDEFKIQ